ncbi:SLBB domain-containing protein [Anabaena cylindrica FACHB-243]|uniref:Polysaccharide export protein n=1 Tax=Anabaena cylindrica (strain ATCC 27899 / PCC 7122) TaxID=272123 RepID=K9ZFM1_ANACC|nr:MULTISPECIES: SLBB domain-containing protein [Anabaena]AFZ58018.1 polysaccharide export protein [Anabaena cylindrica PCC 7122]MBD2420736.1 SLBB domain-containing protein [Anabaena cylindrica FACHB-243]MBY5311734.1 polysaccharide export protein [Anabaena sp. CCAP 1446/1C]MCM2408247.1 SLBB domain-containing protein [Anabaena sp. CCAP 1446/1C]BAY05016.1 polysaccharide export protein [Anabaena cylindrica PCC 7122]
MLNIHLWKIFTHSTTAVVLLTTVNIALPSVSLAQQQPVSSSSISTDYLLGGGDRIRVNVFEVPEYTGEYQVPPGGAINMPLIGSISVLGLTTEQASDEIARRYARFLKRPLISVNLLSSRPINVFVAGEVTRPGSYTLSLEGSGGDSPGVQYPTVLAALTTAQGVTLAADVTKVQLRRKIGRSGEQVVSFNLKELTQTGRISQDITLRDGDTIVVPTATDFNVAEARNLFATNYAASQSSPRTVAITGQVYRPGSYLVTSGTTGGNDGGAPGTGLPTVMRAIQLAGGITSQADVRSIKIRRPTRIGSEQSLNVNLWELLQTGDLNQDVVLQDGDTIVVPTATDINTAEATQLATTTLSPAKIQVGVVGEVKKPGLTDLQPNSSLNQALLAAGGFNDARASSAAVDLIRLNPNGTVSKRIVKIDFSKEINEETNPILRNNDVVVVSRSGIAKTSDTVNTVAGPFGTILGIVRLFFGF